MAKEQRKKTDAARRAKLTIQRRSLCLMIPVSDTHLTLPTT